MAIQIFPVATGSGLTAAQSLVAASPKTLYYADTTLATGIYTITCSSSTIARVQFYTGTTSIGLATTVSGSVAYSLAIAADRVYVWTDTGSSITVNIQKTGEALSTQAPSGTLDTLTTSGTYNQTGKLYVIAVGGGAAGCGLISSYPGKSGGGGGGLDEGFVTTSNATSYTVGAGGNGVGNAVGNNGGATSFGNFFAANGGQITADAGTGGTPRGPDAGASVNAVGSFAKDGGYGGGGGFIYPAGSATGIGTAGSLGAGNGGEPTSGNDATGYGAGGGGAGPGGNNQYGNAWYGRRGGNGAPGVVYVFRGF